MADDPVVADLVRRVGALETELQRRRELAERSLANARLMGAHQVDIASSFSTTSTSFVDVTGSSKNVTKLLAATKVLVLWHLSGWRDDAVNAVLATIGVSVGGTDVGGRRLKFDVDVAHLGWAGFASAAGIAAGTFAIKLRAKTDGFAFKLDANDSFGWSAWEVPSSLGL